MWAVVDFFGIQLIKTLYHLKRDNWEDNSWSLHDENCW